MNKKTREAIIDAGTSVVLLDIDGTIKDLVREHREALTVTINGFTRGCIRKKLVMFLDKIAMSFVTSGILSTNKRKQNFLLNLYALILAKNMREFRDLYNIFYKHSVIVFDGVKPLLQEVTATKKVYLVTTNSQNYNLKEYGIRKEDIICVKANQKIEAYKQVIFENGINPDNILVVGDNIFDDIKPAKKLGCKCLLVDNYNSKLKQFVAKHLNVGM